MEFFKLPDKVYNVLKWLLIIVIPALMTLFNGLALVWQWDIPIEAIDTTVGLVLTCLGTILGISTAAYNKAKAKEQQEN